MFSKGKILGVALATLVAVGLVACGGDSGGDKAKLEAACEACAYHGPKCNTTTYKSDCKALLKIYKDECDKGNGKSCSAAGWSYMLREDGQSVAEMSGEQNDNIEATSWFKKSCDLKNANGCTSLAWIYLVQMRDNSKAGELYRQALQIYEKECDSGNRFSCAEAGNMYIKPRFSDFIFKDYHKGLALLQKYCDKAEKGDTSTTSEAYENCLTLGGMFAEGKGTLQNYEQAKKYFAKVCEFGEQSGCEAYKKANEKSK